tara:strand:- start:904 stop:1101 length:198 start_codon:yes stop_codon:yes gene_type:complete
MFKEINKDNPVVIKFVVEYRCADLPYNPNVIENNIKESLVPIEKHWKEKQMDGRHQFEVYREEWK